MAKSTTPDPRDSYDDPYKEFAAIYDAWQALHPRPFSVAMTLRMYQALDEWGVPENSLLDLSCGSGTLAHWWAARHPDWRIVGADPSAAMIQKAKARAGDAVSPKQAAAMIQKAKARAGDAVSPKQAAAMIQKAKARAGDAVSPKQAATTIGGYATDVARATSGAVPKKKAGDGDVNPRFVHAHPAQLDLNETFGMATCFFDSLNHVTKRAELLSILRQARRHLVPNGLFLFDLIDEDSFEETFSVPWIIQNEELFVATESEFFEKRGSEYGRIDFTCFEKHAETWKRRQFSITERCWRREEFDPLLEEAGLENIHVQLIDPEDQPDVFVSRRLYVCRPKS